MRRNHVLVVAVLLLVLPEPAALVAGELQAFEINAARSTLVVEVARSGFLKTFGHDHVIAVKEFSGRIQVDPEKPENSSVTLRVAAPSLRVADEGISDEDRAEVQSTMLGDKVLAVARFPEIAFASTGFARGENEGEAWNLNLTGTLSLHGVEKVVTFPVVLKITGSDLEAKGEVSLRQTDFGIKPVTAGGGLVKVKDVLRIRFAIHALGFPP